MTTQEEVRASTPHTSSSPGDSQAADDARPHGASYDNNPADESDLPMVVWLRGDEPYVVEFSLDAEAAMKALGIKRSRLTQISGKELRVGRMRIDRYVRPVYRPEDIADYQKWTRATATHQRSSSLLKNAAGEIKEQTAELYHHLRHELSRQTDSIQESLASTQEETYRIQKEAQLLSNQQISDRIDALKQALLETEARISDRAISDVAKMEDNIRTELSELAGKFSDDMAGVAAKLADHDEARRKLQLQLGEFMERVKDIQDQQAHFQSVMAETLSKLIEAQREATNRSDAAIAKLKQASTPSEPATTTPSRLKLKPRRHCFRRNIGT